MNFCDEDIEADDKIVAEEGERELYEHFRFVADKGQSLLRVDKFLVARLESSSRNRVQQAAEAGCILVNGKPVKSNYRVKPLDVVSVVMDRPATNLKSFPRIFPSMSSMKTTPCWWSTNRPDWWYTPATAITAARWSMPWPTISGTPPTTT